MCFLEGNGVNGSAIADGDDELPDTGTSHDLLGENLIVQTAIDCVDVVVNDSNNPSSATLSILSLPNGEVAPVAEENGTDRQVHPGSSAEQDTSFLHDPISASTNLVQLTEPGLNASVDEKSADHPAFSDKQDTSDGSRRTAPLQAAASFASTVPDSESQDASYSEYGSTLVNDETLAFIESATQSVTNAEGDHCNDSMSPRFVNWPYRCAR